MVNFLLDMFLLAFWAAVLAYVPVTVFLVIQNPLAYQIEKARRRGIYILGREFQVRTEKRANLKVLGGIYFLCVVFFLGFYIVNLARTGRPDIFPFDILSSVSVVLFWFAVVTYLPLAVFLALKNPLKYKEEGIYLKRTFILYGIGILVFSGLYAFHWVMDKGLFVTLRDVLIALGVMVTAAAFLSYLPVLGYIMIRNLKPFRFRKVRPNVVFAIYAVCFLLFSGVYIFNWISDRQAGLVMRP